MHKRRSIIMIALAAGLAWPLAASPASAAAAYTPLPAHVYAPYYESYLAPNTPSLTATSQASGAKYFTMAFLQSAGKGSCTLEWNGNASQPLDYYASDIASLRAAGGDVIPSFGGYAADSGGTEIADTCKNVSKLAADYESVITTLGITRLDMDVEAKALTDATSINRRNEALAITEAWAAAQGIPLQIQYTVPVEQTGLGSSGEAVLQNAVTDGTAVTSVNVMVFDYYIKGEGTVDMGQAAINAAASTESELAAIYPNLSSSRLSAMVGMTMLPGIDDYPKKTEVTYLPDAQTMLNLAESEGMNFLSIWGIQRDNGGCPGTIDSDTCSGIVQNAWDFSHLLEPFTS